MSAFKSELDTRNRDTDRKIQAELISPLVYQSDISGEISVPAGFVTDYASVPRFFWRILPPFGKYSKAAVVHDYLYNIGEDRKLADRVFREAMIALGVPAWKRIAMFRAVRWFGWAAYKAKSSD